MANDYDLSRVISDDLLRHLLASFLEINNSDNSIKNILEIGCGTGRLSRIFAINNFNVTGVDISKNMLEIALIKAQEEKWNFTGIIADARNLPFKNNEFDIVYTSHVLHLIKDWEKVILEALRCSKTKRFVNIDIKRSISTIDILAKYWEFIIESDFASQYKIGNKLGAQNAEEIVQYMKTIGFTCIKKEISTINTIKRTRLIDIIKSKNFSAQRFIPDEIHEITLKYLAENNYFFPTNDETLELSEKCSIYTFLMK